MLFSFPASKVSSYKFHQVKSKLSATNPNITLVTYRLPSLVIYIRISVCTIYETATPYTGCFW